MLKQNDIITEIMRTTRKKEPKHELVKRSLKYSKVNRKKWTVYESRLNGWLSNWGLKHQNQAIFPPYIVDILLTDYPLIIELDGSQHELNKDYDRRRDLYLTSLGYTILRIKNNELLDKQKVKASIFRCIN